MVRTRTSSRVITLFVLCLVGCQSAEKASLTPLAPETQMTFGELMQRGRSQLTAASESYYSDSWKELEKASVAIRETGTRLSLLPLPNANEEHKAKVASLTKEYTEAADLLKSASIAQDPVKTNQVFMRLNELYRQLRVEQLIVAPISGPETTPPASGTVTPGKP